MTKRACLTTFGCQMNRLDSELVRSLLEASGYVMTDSDREGCQAEVGKSSLGAATAKKRPRAVALAVVAWGKQQN